MYSIKLVYEDDIRKTSLETSSVDALYAKARILFPELENVSFEQLFVHYFDDEMDKIRIKCDIDLQEALRTVQPQSNVTLKIFIQTQLSTSSMASSSFGTSPNGFSPSYASGFGSNLSSSTVMAPPMVNMFNSFTPLVSSVMQNPVAMQQMSAMMPAMMPFLPQLISSMFLNPNASMQQPSMPMYVPTSDDVVSSSVSTSTFVDARDAFTETSISEVSSQTTQTQVHPSATQTTQTQPNPSQTTQTLQSTSITQTTQTPIASITQTTQTQQIPISAQTTQTQISRTSETQTVQSQQTSCETQATPTGTEHAPDSPSFYDSLHGTFGRLLDQLAELGFTDKEKCIRALVKHGGSLPEAVDELLLEC